MGLRSGINHFLVFSLALLQQTLGNVILASMISAIFKNKKWSFRITLFELFLSFIFSGTINTPENMTLVLGWIRFTQFTYYCSQILAQNQFYGISQEGNEILAKLGYVQLRLWTAFVLALALGLCYGIFGIIALHITSRSRTFKMKKKQKNKEQEEEKENGKKKRLGNH